MHLRLETLEDRLAPAVISWINPAGGAWLDARNWSGGRLPGADDVALIRTGGATITFAGAVSQSVSRLDSDSTLLILQGTLALGPNSRVGRLLQGGGQLMLVGDGVRPGLLVGDSIRQANGVLSLRLTTDRDEDSMPVILVGHVAEFDGRLFANATVASWEDESISVLILGDIVQPFRPRAGAFSDGHLFLIFGLDEAVVMLYDPDEIAFEQFTLFELLTEELAQSAELIEINIEILRTNITLPLRPEVTALQPFVVFQVLTTTVANGSYAGSGAAGGTAEVVALEPLPPAMLLPTDLESLPFEDVAGSATAESVNLLTGQRPRANLVSRGRQVAPVATLLGGDAPADDTPAVTGPVPASNWLIDPTQPPRVRVVDLEPTFPAARAQQLSGLAAVLLAGWAAVRRTTRKHTWPRI